MVVSKDIRCDVNEEYLRPYETQIPVTKPEVDSYHIVIDTDDEKLAD